MITLSMRNQYRHPHKNIITENEGGLFGTGPHWATENGEVIYFAIFNKQGTGFKWVPGKWERTEKGKVVWEGPDKWH